MAYRRKVCHTESVRSLEAPTVLRLPHQHLAKSERSDQGHAVRAGTKYT